jgi:hypothetical protein
MIPVASQKQPTNSNRFQGETTPLGRKMPLAAVGDGLTTHRINRVQFGSAGDTTVNKFLLPTFQKLTEVFLWSFIGVDFACLWVPRITTSLVTGAVPYDSRKDPSAQNLSFPHLAARWTEKNISGLNWKNLHEETKREVASGPGTLAIPAVIFMGVRHILKKRPMELSYHSIEGLGQGFQQHLEKNHSATQDVRDYTKALGQYVDSIFTDPNLRNTRLNQVSSEEELRQTRSTLNRILDNPKNLTAQELEKFQQQPALKALLERQPKLGNALRELLAANAQAKDDLRKQLTLRPMLKLLREPNAERHTYGEYLKRWSQAWAETAMSPTNKGNRSNRLANMRILHEDLLDSLKTFNLKHRQEAYKLDAMAGDATRTLADEQPIHKVDRAWLRYTDKEWSAAKQKMLTLGSKQHELSRFTDELERWSDFASDAWKVHGKHPQAEVAQVVDKMRRQLVKQKLLLSIGSTVLACAYMVHLAFWAQNYGSYQANRLLKDKPLAPPSGLSNGGAPA